MPDITLNSDGLDTIKNMLYEQIYKSHGVTDIELLREYSVGALLVSLMKKAGYGFGSYHPGKGPEKKSLPIAYLPENFSTGTYDREAFREPMRFLVNDQFRASGFVTTRLAGNHQRAGTESFHVINRKIIELLVADLAERLNKEKELGLPLPLHRFDTDYAARGPELKAAFCKGIGMDILEREESFGQLVRRALLLSKLYSPSRLSSLLDPVTLGFGTNRKTLSPIIKALECDNLRELTQTVRSQKVVESYARMAQDGTLAKLVEACGVALAKHCKSQNIDIADRLRLDVERDSLLRPR